MYPYSPLHAPRKEVSEETMMETLKRRVRESVEKHINVAGAGSSQEASGAVAAANPLPTAAALQWDKPVKTTSDGQGYQRSTCQRFVIAKTKNMGEFVYTASRCAVPYAKPLGAFNTPELARAFCEKHQ